MHVQTCLYTLYRYQQLALKSAGFLLLHCFIGIRVGIHIAFVPLLTPIFSLCVTSCVPYRVIRRANIGGFPDPKQLSRVPTFAPAEMSQPPQFFDRHEHSTHSVHVHSCLRTRLATQSVGFLLSPDLSQPTIGALKLEPVVVAYSIVYLPSYCNFVNINFM